MRFHRFSRYGLVGVALAGAVALGAELQRPAPVVDTHAMRNTAASRLINDPRLAPLLSQSAQRALAPLRTSSNDLHQAPIPRLLPATGLAGQGTWITPNPPLAFNNDRSGLPQNTESVTNCNAGGTIIGAYFDFRSVVTGGDASAWSISTDGGKTLANSNFLPGIRTNVVVSGPVSGPVSGSGGTNGPASGPTHVYVATQGDPVIRATSSCTVYATSPAFAVNGPFVNAVVADMSTAATLSSCTSENACWPKRRAIVVDSTGERFFDRPTIAVPFNAPGAPVWIGYSEFDFSGYQTPTFSVDVVRCDSLLNHCTKPIVLESDQEFFAASRLTKQGGAGGGGGGGGSFGVPMAPSIAIGSNGATHVSWATVVQPLFGPPVPESMTVNVASAPPGSTSFGQTVPITTVNQAEFQPVAGELVAVDGLPHIAVSHVGGVDRLHVVYGMCRAESDQVCEHADALLASSQSGAVGTWSYKAVDPGANSDFFPTVTADTGNGALLVGLLTTRFDPAWHRFDVLLVPVNAATGAQSAAIRVTSVSIEPDNGSLDSYTIGDYWDLTAYNGTAWPHFTTTQRLQLLSGQGVPVPQEDNALAHVAY